MSLCLVASLLVMPDVIVQKMNSWRAWTRKESLFRTLCGWLCLLPLPPASASASASCLCLLPLPPASVSCLLPLPPASASASCLLPLPPASASCLVPGVRTSAPNRVVRHELKTTAQCGAALPTAPRAYTAAARAAQRRQGSAKKRKDPGLISGQQHRPPDYVEQKSASPQSPPRSAPSSA